MTFTSHSTLLRHDLKLAQQRLFFFSCIAEMRDPSSSLNAMTVYQPLCFRTEPVSDLRSYPESNRRSDVFESEHSF